MSEDTPPLPDDVRSLLDVESDLAPAPEGAKGRVHARVLATIGAFPGPGGGSGGGGGGGGGGFALASIGTHLLTFALGAGTAVAIVAAYASHEPARVVYVDRPAPVIAPEALVSVTPYALPAAPAAEPAPPPPAPSVSAHAEQTEDRQLAREREMLDVARTALGRSDAPDALAAIDKHARRYPTGLLAQEREAMAVQALLLAGRTDEARARGQRFMQQYPNSVLGPAVSAALASIP